MFVENIFDPLHSIVELNGLHSTVPQAAGAYFGGLFRTYCPLVVGKVTFPSYGYGVIGSMNTGFVSHKSMLSSQTEKIPSIRFFFRYTFIFSEDF